VTYCRDEDIDTTALPVGLRTRLEPWQLQGQHKLCQLADGPWRGGWLADAVGLGKSLTALVAALRIRNEKRLKGFVLVVCPKQCVPQWYQEVQKHWTLVSL
jgi:SNF2 family DNA or RNA helicase